MTSLFKISSTELGKFENPLKNRLKKKLLYHEFISTVLSLSLGLFLKSCNTSVYFLPTGLQEKHTSGSKSSMDILLMLLFNRVEQQRSIVCRHNRKSCSSTTNLMDVSIALRTMNSKKCKNGKKSFSKLMSAYNNL